MAAPGRILAILAGTGLFIGAIATAYGVKAHFRDGDAAALQFVVYGLLGQAVLLVLYKVLASSPPFRSRPGAGRRRADKPPPHTSKLDSRIDDILKSPPQSRRPATADAPPHRRPSRQRTKRIFPGMDEETAARMALLDDHWRKAGTGRRRWTPATERLQIAPLVLVRRPLADRAGWHSARSWLGGLPKMGSLPWPRQRHNGLPMTFLAQIDLREVARHHPHSPLPSTGALAFFAVPHHHDESGQHADDGAVLYIPPAQDTIDTPLPDDAPPLCRTFGDLLFRDPQGNFPPRFFPRWPASLTPCDERKHDPATCAEDFVRRLAPSPYSFSARQALERAGLDTGMHWWHGAHLYLDFLRHRLAAISQRGEAGARQPSAQALRQLLPSLCREMADWLRPHDPWQRMAGEDVRHLATFIMRHEAARIPACKDQELLRISAKTTLERLQTASVIALATGPDDALSHLPHELMACIDTTYLLPPDGSWHQMFGRGTNYQGAVDWHEENFVLLLQLEYDTVMHWHFGDVGHFQFWILPAALKRHHWTEVNVTLDQ